MLKTICLKKVLAILLSVLLATPLFVLTTFAEGDGFTRLNTASIQCETGEMWYNRSALASATGTEGYRNGYYYISEDANTIKIEYAADGQLVTELRTRDADAQYFDYLFVLPAFGDPLPTSEDGLEDGAYWYDQAGLVRLAELTNSSESTIYIYTHAVFRLSVDGTMLRMVYTTQDSEETANRDEFASSANFLYGFLRQKGVDPNAGFTLLPTSEEGLEDGEYWFDLSSLLQTLSESNQQLYSNAQYYLSEDGDTLRISLGMNIDATREDEPELFSYLHQVGVDPNAGFTLLPTSDEGLSDGDYWFDAAGLADAQDFEELATAQYYLSDDGDTIRLITPSLGQLDVARDSDTGTLVFPFLRQVGVDPNAIEGFTLLPFSEDGLEEGEYWFDVAMLAEVTGNDKSMDYLYYLSDDGNTIRIKYDASFSVDITRDDEYSDTVFPYLRQVGVDPNPGFTRLPKSADGLEAGEYWFDAAGFAAMAHDTSYQNSIYYLSDDGNTLRINSSGYVFDVTKGSGSASVYFIYLHKVGEVYTTLPTSDEGLEEGAYWFDASGWANYADDESYRTATYSLNAEAGILCIIKDGEEAYYMNGGEYSILFQFLKQVGVDPNEGFTLLPTSADGLDDGDYWFDAAAFGAANGFEEDEIPELLTMLSCYLSEDGETLRLIYAGNVIDIPADDEYAEEYWAFLHQFTVDPNEGFTLLPTSDEGLEIGAYWYDAAGLNAVAGGTFAETLFYLSNDGETLRLIYGGYVIDIPADDENSEVYWAFLRQVTPGDINGDGEVNVQDVTALTRYLSGGWSVTINERNSDVNGDGKITLKDVTLIRRFLAGGWGVELV